ncbi:MAG: trehalose-binding protein [Deltaproteobacteria bacterium RBG_13_60_28]|nr:MAG: trehalose-binding protein [Deltaproteobacteria bacterium RBG_13_60_28]
MKIGPHSFAAFLKLVQSFHGYIAPGVVIGGIMVDQARRLLPPEVLFDAFSETRNCLPDAVQLLTPCTTGNGWLKVVDLGRFALSLYDKYQGEGVRVFLDLVKAARWPEIEAWYLKLKPKQEQDSALLLEQIRQAGPEMLGWHTVKVRPQFLQKRSRGRMAICPLCREAYPAQDGGICRGCQGEAPYLTAGRGEEAGPEGPALKRLPLAETVGRRALHDMTMIVPGVSKGPAFEKGQLIGVGDLCRLQQMGRRHLYVLEDNQVGPEWVHEDAAALAFARAAAGEGVTFTEPPREGKVNFLAARDGLLVVDEARLETFNLVPGVMCACRQGFSVLSQGRMLGGTRAIPLYLPRADFEKALAVLRDGPLFRVLPLRQPRVGILVTGTEVFMGLVEDRFIPIITTKVEKFGGQVIKFLIVPDEGRAIREGVKELLDRGIDLLVTTAGLSVDPDDVTRQGLVDAGATDILYGAPILPGAMTLLARIGPVQVMGVPACALYFKTTSFDLLLPRLLAGIEITRRDLAHMGHGAFCQECKLCTFPQKCPFGK